MTDHSNTLELSPPSTPAPQASPISPSTPESEHVQQPLARIQLAPLSSTPISAIQPHQLSLNSPAPLPSAINAPATEEMVTTVSTTTSATDSPQLSQPHSTTSLPIPTSARTSNASITTRKISVFCTTWNLYGQLPEIDLSPLIPVDKYDIYVIGTEECERSIGQSLIFSSKVRPPT